jgi:3-keto-disaccharide hydrolase
VRVSLVTLFLACAVAALSSQSASPFIGRWDLTLATANGPRPSWLEIQTSGPRTLVGRFVGPAGSARPISKIEVAGETFSFSIPPQWESGDKDLRVEGRVEGDHLTGSLTNPSGTRVTWTAARAPSLQRTGAVEWGDPVEIFNGRDTSGWHVQQGANRWVVTDHTLTCPRALENLVSDRTFTDFTLHIEFRYPKGSNSGIYLRGRYEVQIEDSAGLESPSERLGAIYGFLAPSDDAAKKAGDWQAFDIVLTGRMVTVILNGTTIIANQEIPGITGGAIDSNEATPGPIMLQGDHGPVEFRKIIVRPAK